MMKRHVGKDRRVIRKPGKTMESVSRRALWSSSVSQRPRRRENLSCRRLSQRAEAAASHFLSARREGRAVAGASPQGWLETIQIQEETRAAEAAAQTTAGQAQTSPPTSL